MVHRHPTANELLKEPVCSVCESNITKDDIIVCLPCKHLFHPECIIPWLKLVCGELLEYKEQHNTCPDCRASLPEMNSDEEDDEDENDRNNSELVVCL